MESQKGPVPIFGILSVFGPLAWVGVGLIGLKLVDREVIDPFIVFLSIIGCWVGSMIMVGIGAWRDERWRALRWIGLLVNLAPTAYFFFSREAEQGEKPKGWGGLPVLL